MPIKLSCATALLCLGLMLPAHAEDAMAMHHGGGLFHMFRAETAFGGGSDGIQTSWDVDGWVGGDSDKLWLKSEGKVSHGVVEEAELWALYSRNIATFWDVQIGIRHDRAPVARTYAALGFEGLAPYFVETAAHLFVGETGAVSGRLRLEGDILLTQKTVLQPYAEINLQGMDEAERGVGAGLANGHVGLQTRYELTRKFAPYIDLHYERKFGQTATIARTEGEAVGAFTAAIGLRLMF